MNFRKSYVSLLGALAISGAANAAVLVSSTGSPANIVTDYSTPSLVAFDLDLANFSSTRLNFVIESGDLLGPLSLNALIRNLSGVTPAFGTIAGIGFTSNLATIDFRTPEFSTFSVRKSIRLERQE